jgi:hypothetical protein
MAGDPVSYRKLDGPSRGPDPPGVADALRRLSEGQSRTPTEADRPPPSLFPMTPAARAAIRASKKGWPTA